ncbi:MAG: dienelactone hydrolase family protein [Acidimicrobiales bacterium]
MHPTRRSVALVAALLVGMVGCSSGAPGRPGDAARDPASTATTGPTTTTGPDRSPGCGDEAPASGRSAVTVSSGAAQRSYIRYIPDGLSEGAAPPLVIDLTAYAPASLQESFSGFTKPDGDGTIKADEVGAIVVTPEPVNGKGLLTWNVADAVGWTDDQRFVTDLVDDVAARVCIDTGRVLAMGFAIGGVMASRVACEQSERITALVTVSGLWDPPDCMPEQAVPVLSFHGTNDHFLPFEGGVGDRVGLLNLSPETSAGLVAMASRPGAVAASGAWAARNGCDETPEEQAVTEGVTRTSWAGCVAGVELYVVDGSHTWPGSNGMAAVEGLLGPVSTAITANDVIWNFFEAQRDT